MKLNNKCALKCSMNFLYQFERGPHAPCATPAISECDSDDDDEVVAFVDESDSETEVPVNTPGSTRTRAGRLSMPNFRYLD